MTYRPWILRLRGRTVNWDRWAAGLFFTVSVCTALIVGIGVGTYRWFPFDVLRVWRLDVIKFRRDWRADLGLAPVNHMRRARYEGAGVTKWQQERTQPGYTFMTGMFDGQVGVQLITMAGEVVHRWDMGYTRIWPEPTHVPPDDRPRNDLSVMIHGGVLLPDGSVVCNFSKLGMAKVDVNDRVVWKVSERPHHQIDMDEDGTFWTLNLPQAGRGGKDLRPIRALWWERPVIEETILHVSADGEVLDEIFLLDLLLSAGLEGLIYNNALTFRIGEADITHLNDVEALRSEDARAFPWLDPGDLLISARNMNLILILDPKTHRIKWHHTGPWMMQHDPDFRPDGRISVFDNRRDLTFNGSILGGSRIVVIDPITYEWGLAYGGTDAQHFYSGKRGTHQQLDNGNLLIAESDAGRVIEVTPSGEIVWEYINRVDADKVGLVLIVARYPTDYIDASVWKSSVP